MVFSSITFLCAFLPVVFALHALLPGMRAKNALLIVASLAFYAYGEPVYVLLMVASSLANWLLGLAVGRLRETDPGASKAMLAVAVVANLAFLGTFKYLGMVVSTAAAVFGVGLSVPDIALPIGISFYTFQAMSYVIDVYRAEVPAQRSYFRVLLYIAFFPQLIAGPIIKYHDVERQLETRRVTVDGVATGLRRFCFGLAKKVLIANTMAAAVDAVYAAPAGEVNFLAAWIAALGYLLQIYFDFSGYSDMAIGMARMFGFEYKENFNYPYASTDVKTFWRRWHISLSTWFKEYLYIPLGGNRKGRPRTVLNKIIVFFLCGLWHGASWTFALWGLLHGLLLLFEEYVPVRKLPKVLGWLYTVLAVMLLFVLFRADDLAEAGLIVSQMFTGFRFDAASMSLGMQQLSPLFAVTLAVGCVAAFPVKGAVERWAAEHGRVAVAAEVGGYVLAALLLVLCLLGLSGGGYNPFIYFRF